ncbi:hypothetical protein BUALT_Bualt19G0045000 [Buddleja alternifolia]|uniref:Zinc finger CCCH domain-containing protein 53-like n=1 Tax=Buddleja alternifolia TaxID=168488 RepID=A0AAV6W266_9LAMI|nr:hypothetical protein BUALT_Bualt19G0045000 [Buddleja alternifolia]
MGLLLIQDHGEKEMIRLAFGPESLLQSVILKSRIDLNLPSPNTPSTPSSPSSPLPFSNNPLSLSRQNSSSSRLLPSPLSITTTTNNHFSASASSFSDDHLIPPYAEVDLIDELHLQDQLSFLNDGNDAVLFPSYPATAGPIHRRSCSVSDICMGSDDLSGGGFGWKPCLFYARGYCKNGTTCRFLHGGEGAADGGAVVGSPSKFEMMEQCQEQLLRSKALMMNRARLERGEFAMNPGSRQIYLTFPADSTFKEEDVSNYFSNFGPVQDVRIPYQQKRMFGFVTFDYPETVKLILAKGNPHFVCDARVLVKPYKEKGKIPDKLRKQQMERGEFGGCGSPTGLDSRDPYDIQLGARMLYNTQDMLWRRKLEEQADLQQAIELQNRRIMSLQLLDVKRNSHHRTLSTGAVISSPTFSPRFLNQNVVISSNRSSPEAKEENPTTFTADQEMRRAVNVTEKDKDIFVNNENNSNGREIPPKESDFQESFEHNLPDSPFASPKAAVNYVTAFSNTTLAAEKCPASASAPSISNNLITGSSLFPANSSLDMAPFKSCYFQLPRFASGHETIGM